MLTSNANMKCYIVTQTSWRQQAKQTFCCYRGLGYIFKIKVFSYHWFSLVIE